MLLWCNKLRQELRYQSNRRQLKVNAKKIYLNNINASTTYGSKDGLRVDGNVSLQDNSIVYGDKVSLKDGASVSYKADGEYAANKGDRETADAGTYKADVAVQEQSW